MDQLLTLSRLESQSHPQECTELRWSAIINDAIAQTAPDAAVHQVSVIPDLAAPELTVRGEQLLLTVMLRNLLHNAIRYGKTGGTVQLTLTPQQLVIEDDGRASVMRYWPGWENVLPAAGQEKPAAVWDCLS